MLIDIKELRDSTGMTQKEFASRYGIPNIKKMGTG